MAKIAKPDKTRQEISPEQERAIPLLLMGKTDQEVAGEIGVSRQTVNDWQRNDLLFIAELNLRRKNIWKASEEKLRSLVGKAIQVLEEDLESEDRQIRQKASIAILKSIVRQLGNINPQGQAETVEDIQEIRKQKAMQKENDKFLSSLSYI